ncbi:uncharacterized protein M437DRAFT_74370 [Aureobasidium melanogenum CBS 110374]|uniref:Uncharacterized protein n=1 Tax=Aureobasidium melanogenum (strain CBS 110374) TaxID=1043003 RepID=A0A074VX05_AURM1|nr:uncharacterized protein M437DRAFT_74370 [Aureobasidium melanogenum CBS 110374]KEQ63799.1 hypothetical protein M437DRAFT_74370 [Aureobasidium melanogenum CBS 110374]
MDTLAKETMGLPIFICPTNHQIISSGSGSSNTTSSTSTIMRFSDADLAAASPPTSPTSTQYSPTTSFFATATATRSPTAIAFPSILPSASTTSTNRDTRRNTYTYTPPTFSPDHRRESLLSTHRLSAAFDFASSFASEVLSKAADQVFGNEEGRAAEAGMQLWGEDLEAGERENKEKGRYSRFGEEGAFESWLD